MYIIAINAAAPETVLYKTTDENCPKLLALIEDGADWYEVDPVKNTVAANLLDHPYTKITVAYGDGWYERWLTAAGLI